MTAITFDTLKFARRLTQAGVPREQAEAEAEALIEALDNAELVTTQYFDAKLAAATANIIKWVAGLLLAQAGLVAALVKLLL